MQQRGITSFDLCWKVKFVFCWHTERFKRKSGRESPAKGEIRHKDCCNQAKPDTAFPDCSIMSPNTLNQFT